MARTNEVPAVGGQEVIGECLQRDELVWAPVDVCVCQSPFLHDDDIEFILPLAENDICGAGIVEIGSAAQKDHFSPPARQMIFHCPAVTG